MKNKKVIISIAIIASLAIGATAFAVGADFFNNGRYLGFPNNGGVTVNTTSTIVLAANASALGTILTNAGANGEYLSFGTGGAAVVGTGVYLAPNGGAITLDGQMLWQGGIQAIASGGTSTLTFTQF